MTVEMLERDLYERRTLVRMHGVRRTMFVVPVAMAPLLEAGAARAYLPGQINRIARLAEADGVARDGVAWVRDLMDAAAKGLEGRGPTSASELTALVPDLATKLAMGRGTVGITSRVLYLLGSAGRVVRGRPRGSWIASQYSWSLTEDWFGGRWDNAPGPEAARADLLGRWLGAYGPGSMVDLRWWTGWSKAHVTSALETIGAVEVQLDGGTGFVVSGDEGPTPDPGPWAAFLPGPRSDSDGLERAGMVRCFVSGSALRPQRQHRTHHMVQRPGRGCVGDRSGWSRPNPNGRRQCRPGCRPGSDRN